MLTSPIFLPTGAEAVSKGVVWGAGKLSELISYGSESLKDYVQPVAEKKEVDPKWHKRAEVARDISGKAVKVSGYLCEFVVFILYYSFLCTILLLPQLFAVISLVHL